MKHWPSLWQVAHQRERERADLATEQLQDLLHTGLLNTMTGNREVVQHNSSKLDRLKAKTRELQSKLQSTEVCGDSWETAILCDALT